ncbi:unnamed protein product [Ranitomeya imitator]|uniref:UDENN FNIP1/2-type domain-containing protein n=1 Tax=Ranitomeya imitator TaxID=111125 RepID=A0ABN9LLK6_9NEOB|nr:unnamed protein product [Ranitomeya imitator]
MDSGNIFELEATGGGESLDVRFEGQGRVKGYSKAADFWDRGKCDFIYFHRSEVRRRGSNKIQTLSDKQQWNMYYLLPKYNRIQPACQGDATQVPECDFHGEVDEYPFQGNIGGLSTALQNAVDKPLMPYTKPASDVNMLGEMMFGSVAMSYKGSTLKIHLIRCPLQLMISKVFSAKVGGFSTSTSHFIWMYAIREKVQKVKSALSLIIEGCEVPSRFRSLSVLGEVLGYRHTIRFTYDHDQRYDLAVIVACYFVLLEALRRKGCTAVPLVRHGLEELFSMEDINLEQCSCESNANIFRSALQFNSIKHNSQNIQDSVENMSHDGTGHKLGVSHTGQDSCPTASNLAHSTPVDMPSRGQNEDKDSGIARSASLSSLLITPLPSPNSSFSSNCASSYQRRWLRSQITSLENGVVPRWNTEETFSMADDSYTSNPAMVGRKKIAISILFSLSEAGEAQHNFQDFFFSHFPLFESHMNKLKFAIEKVTRPSGRLQPITLAQERLRF